MTVTAEDREALRQLIGCQHPQPCDWVGIIIVQHGSTRGRKWRACREHAAEFRGHDDYFVRDLGIRNQRIPALKDLQQGIAMRYSVPLNPALEPL